MKSIGILGDGQLARMMSNTQIASKNEIRVLSDQTFSPAHQTRAKIFSPSDAKFFEGLHVLTLENEFFPSKWLPQTYNPLLIPKIEIVEKVRNKLKQKELFDKLSLPTAKWGRLPTPLQEKNLEQVLHKFPNGVMLKWAMGGYDGKGNFKLSNKEMIQEALLFCKKAEEGQVNVYYEELIPFSKELAMVYVCGPQFKSYPLVETIQKDNVCHLVKGPHKKDQLEKKAHEVGQLLARELNYCGVFALEFFLYQDNILINEMAPRVHNSGHYTMDVNIDSQFSSHLKCLLGIETDLSPQSESWGMLNIIGEKEGPLPEKLPLMDPPHFLKIHWYGKSQSRPGRKLGHINILANSPLELESRIQEALELEKKLWSLIWNH
jgi:phosphoribosylaminoimidazole carboxylase PurK protein